MHRLVVLLAGFLFIGSALQAQPTRSKTEFDAYCAAFFPKVQALSAAKQYREALAGYAEWEQVYGALALNTKPEFSRLLANVNYNKACFYALLRDRPNAVRSFQRAVESGYRGYRHASTDSDLDFIRRDKGFRRQLASIREHGDYVYVLQQAKGYAANDDQKLPAFRYQEADAPKLAALRKTYRLDSIAGAGSEVSRFINLLHWVHEQVPHDGNVENPASRNAHDLLAVCQRDRRGLNCRGLATVLNEVYLAMGYRARFVGCLPKDTTDVDSHVINTVYSVTLQKWLWMDPTNDAYVMNEQGSLLGIEEVRARLIDGRPLLLNPTANWNHKVSKAKEDYLYGYMAKNLYQLQCPVSSQYDLETRAPGKTLQYVSLVPATAAPKQAAAKTQRAGATTLTTYVTSSAAAFWQKP